MVFNKDQYKELLQDMEIKDPIVHKIIKKHGYLKPTPKKKYLCSPHWINYWTKN